MPTVEIVSRLLPSLDEALARAGLPSEDCLDGRDAVRLANFVPMERWTEIGVKPIDEMVTHEAIPWTAATVAEQLERDVSFAFHKALGKRGISASLMSDVLTMWHRILKPPFDLPGYAQYGLPICKAMAVYFELPNRIGDDTGSEYEYSSDAG